MLLKPKQEETMSDPHSNRRVVSHPSPAASRQPASGTFPVQPARGLAEALLEALEQLERANLQTTRRTNPDDDDEDPTRRA